MSDEKKVEKVSAEAAQALLETQSDQVGESQSSESSVEDESLEANSGASEEKPQESAPPVPKIKGLFLGDRPKIETEIFVYVDKDTREVRTYGLFRIDNYVNNAELLNVEEESLGAVFDMPSKKDIDRMKMFATRWDPGAQAVLLNELMYRKRLINKCLESIRLPENEPYKLPRLADGTLTDESEEWLESLHPAILDMLGIKFQQVANLS